MTPTNIIHAAFAPVQSAAEQSEADIAVEAYMASLAIEEAWEDQIRALDIAAQQGDENA